MASKPPSDILRKIPVQVQKDYSGAQNPEIAKILIVFQHFQIPGEEDGDIRAKLLALGPSSAVLAYHSTDNLLGERTEPPTERAPRPSQLSFTGDALEIRPEVPTDTRICYADNLRSWSYRLRHNRSIPVR